MPTDVNQTFNGFTGNMSHIAGMNNNNDESMLLNNSYAPTALNNSNINIKNGRSTFVRMGKAAAPISSVQMAKDVYRKNQIGS